jgi:hypothetical protein
MENEATKALQTAKAQVENIMQYQDDLRRTISSQDINNLKKALVSMTNHLNKIINGEKIAPTQEEIDLVRNITRSFANIAMEKPIVPIFRDLSASLLPIIHNWNTATINNSDITTHIRLTDGIIKAQLTFMDTLDVIQKTLERVRKTHSYEPPAFNLSRAYLDNLKKAIEEKGSDALVPPKKEEPAGAKQ